MGAILLICLSIGQAQSPTADQDMQAKILKGFQIAPVPLNLLGKDPAQVGYGSYLVNAVAGCNDCHSAGAQTQYAAGGVPYFGQHPTKPNPAVYMGGGNDFGAFPADPFPHIISRNLTPDSSGLPEGGNTFQQFLQIMRTGVDMDHIHPTCSGPPDGKCLPAPFNGDLLQIMPWPNYQNLSDSDLQAIYTYLSTIPCLEGGPNEPKNRCTASPNAARTMASASPKNATVTSRSIMLDGTASTSADGKALTYVWSIPQGSPSAGILQGTTATPTIQFGSGRGVYTFMLTVTDSAGISSSDMAMVNFQGN
jgi:cytochrome c553